MKVRLVACLAALALFATASLADKEEIDWETIKCVVSGKKISKDVSTDYKEAKLFFCCEGCPNAFAKDKDKFASKANHQLVATKQFAQEKCPLSGRDLNEEITEKVAGLKVAFCCKNCQGKVAKAEDDEKLSLVFSEASFKKGFKKAEKEEGQQ